MLHRGWSSELVVDEDFSLPARDVPTLALGFRVVGASAFCVFRASGGFNCVLFLFREVVPLVLGLFCVVLLPGGRPGFHFTLAVITL